MSESWLTLVGIGEDGRAGLSPAAADALAQAALVVGGRRHLALAGPLAAETLAWPSPMDAAYPTILRRRGTPVAVLASGDPYHYGVGAALARLVPAAEMRCFPQPSAFALATARLGWAFQDCAALSLCGRPVETLVPALRDGARVLALSADAATPGAVAELLRRRGFGASRVTVLETMGGPRERTRTATAEGFRLDAIDALNTIAIEVAGQGAALSLLPGRPDALFEHDGQITKSDVRAATLARLAPRRGELLWDVGASSGSVAVEWMLAHPANRAVAVERHPERAARARRNAAALGVPGLAVVEGAAPAALAGLPEPDAVFVGGGATGGGVLDACAAALKPGGRLVVNAVTIETQAALIERFRRDGGALTTLAVAQADAVGGFHGWRPAMPVTVWSWVKPRAEKGARVAIGLGFRKAATADTLAALVTDALSRLPSRFRTLPATLATIAEKDRPSLREAASRLGLPVAILPKSALAGTADRITVESEAARACLGIPSVAEAAALAAAGPGAQLVVARIAVPDATCAIALRESS